jgi:hypothetical protein
MDESRVSLAAIRKESGSVETTFAPWQAVTRAKSARKHPSMTTVSKGERRASNHVSSLRTARLTSGRSESDQAIASRTHAGRPFRIRGIFGSADADVSAEDVPKRAAAIVPIEVEHCIE